ncbi:MAG: type II toxin-antitoxin system RelE/ParE family toxin [Chloroflexota bacterium]|nr:type II toxin-antitoxin system RelE/ParE family toxin [Chloroflexota bacterium]MDE2896462.1 type II toxin-antitoxin system RelE/ParE family toxin [Chloroflexota bacterium]
MSYTVDFDPEARRELSRLGPRPKEQVNKVLKRLRAGPDYALDVRLHGQNSMWRATAGRRWRVVYEVRPDRQIQIMRIRRRRDVYEGIEHPGPRDIREPKVIYQGEAASVPAAAAD